MNTGGKFLLPGFFLRVHVDDVRFRPALFFLYNITIKGGVHTGSLEELCTVMYGICRNKCCVLINAGIYTR